MTSGWQRAASREFDYRPGFRPRGLMPGAHKGLAAGAGHELRDRVSLLEHPDPRRLALRSSVQDPFNQLHVHVFNQHSRIPVQVLLDASASMGGRGLERKWALTLDFIEALAFSAWRFGDQLGLATTPVLGEPLTATRSESLVQSTLQRLRETLPQAATPPDFDGLAHALPATPGMVFLVSDFHLPVRDLEPALATLTAMHDVVPIVVWNEAEMVPRRRFGFMLARDAETGRERHIWVRPGLARKLQLAAEERRQALLRLFRSFGLEPFFLEGRVDSSRLNAYFADR
ncbi:hypothetical protein M0534_09730 [Methylonatrum kenyense]|uniref:DUF58 domain-containing protein n=1 Tax=Methylonatrum kenyense TaxID=455253 RepID=UPI0020BED28B|nr:hypothetical protein [Methylonatrum kenyense]MCK8516601.1 hypothetical protein [Methylonatrum kenyense]